VDYGNVDNIHTSTNFSKEIKEERRKGWDTGKHCGFFCLNADRVYERETALSCTFDIMIHMGCIEKRSFPWMANSYIGCSLRTDHVS
jgi:hypothetical protein